VLVAAVLLRLVSGSYYSANMFILLLLSSLAFWEMTVVGSDLIALSSAFLCCTALIFGAHRRGRYWLPLGLALTAAVSTSRVVFAYFAGIIGAFLWKQRGWRQGLMVLLGVAVMVLAMHAPFLVWSEGVYPPLHLVAKGTTLLSGGLLVCSVIMCAIVAAYVILRCGDRFDSWVFMLWLSLLVPMALLSLGGLMNRSFDFARWEEANYLVVPVPVYVFYVCLTSFESDRDLPTHAEVQPAAITS
jgi:hypothetical protein